MSPLESGVVLQGVDEPGRFEELVERIERNGYQYLWITDSSLHSRDPYVYLSLAARRSPRLRLGTAVTNPLTRHPGVTAVSIATVDQVSGRRAILGIGAGDRPIHALGLSPARITVVRAAVEGIRRLLAGESVTGKGPPRFDQARLRIDARPDLPVFLAASGPNMLALAGEIADGVIVLAGLAAAGLRFAVEQVEAGARRAGRRRPHVAVFAYGAVSEDEEEALDAARPIAAWFPQTAPHYCELAGLDEHLVATVKERYGGGEFQEARDAAKLLPDWFVRTMALAGNREHARKHLRTLTSVGVDSVHVFPLGPNRAETIDAFAECTRDVSGDATPTSGRSS